MGIFNDTERRLRSDQDLGLIDGPDQAVQRSGTNAAPLPLFAPAIQPSKQFARIDGAVGDPRIDRFANQSSGQNPFTRKQRNALIKPYGYRIDQPQTEDEQ